MIYEAYADSSGTDTFSYAVEDWTGQRAQARIRVGVFRAGADSGVYARDDAVTLRPGTAATVPVTINDICGDDAELTVRDDLETQGIADATVDDNVISFTTPQQAGTAYIVYTVANKAGISDTATLTVTVDRTRRSNRPRRTTTGCRHRRPSTSGRSRSTCRRGSPTRPARPTNCGSRWIRPRPITHA